MSQSQSHDAESQKYNVLFKGEVSKGFAPEKVKRNLIKMYHVPPNLVDGAFTGTPLMVKDNVDYKMALQYKTIFEKAGTICRIEAIKFKQKEKPLVKSRNGELEITKPEGWIVKECDHDAYIQIVNREKDLCFSVMSEIKSDFLDDIDYMKCSEIARDSLVTKDPSYRKVSGPVGIVIGGMRGVQHEIVGGTGEKRLKTLQVILDGKKYYHLLIASAAESVYTSEKPTFEDILLSFHEHITE